MRERECDVIDAISFAMQKANALQTLLTAAAAAQLAQLGKRAKSIKHKFERAAAAESVRDKILMAAMCMCSMQASASLCVCVCVQVMLNERLHAKIAQENKQGETAATKK